MRVLCNACGYAYQAAQMGAHLVALGVCGPQPTATGGSLRVVEWIGRKQRSYNER